MCADTWDSQPGTALGTGEGPWLNTGPECSRVGLARSTLLPSPTAQPAPLMLLQKLASARRQAPTTPSSLHCPVTARHRPTPTPGLGSFRTLERERPQPHLPEGPIQGTWPLRVEKLSLKWPI